MALNIAVIGATGNLGRQVVQQALQAGHQVTALVRNPARMPRDDAGRLVAHAVDLSTITTLALAGLLSGHDAVINTAGFVSDGDRFVTLVDRVISAVEALPADARPVCWFLAGAGLLDLDNRGRRGLDLPKVRETYWPHAKNLARLQRSALDWRLLCPGPMTESDPVGVPRLRISRERLPVVMPALTDRLPGWLVLPFFARRMPQMIVSYADAAALMLAQLAPDSPMRHHRVGLALPEGMKGRKRHWTARKSTD